MAEQLHALRDVLFYGLTKGEGHAQVQTSFELTALAGIGEQPCCLVVVLVHPLSLGVPKPQVSTAFECTRLA